MAKVNSLGRMGTTSLVVWLYLSPFYLHYADQSRDISNYNSRWDVSILSMFFTYAVY